MIQPANIHIIFRKVNFMPEKINSSKGNYTIDVLLLSTKVEGASICSRRNRGDTDFFRLVKYVPRMRVFECHKMWSHGR